ncbi:hypothetical protein TH61_05910 [Rufibacter sp. DG15C]|uniref:hypothetical protein n=1 Tax=Rufibacter sp. DG15C TaxID=1379909 RepID=UPI00078B3AE2|nr:hypothetical protein [Rufibacter sp. DG15C]AMM50806.1 hypothetical protein TH61_05910 [Rufibacter sp. DG15C]
MPYNSNNTNQRGSENKGNPSGRGQSKADVKQPGNPDQIKRDEEIVAKHVREGERPTQDAVTHPNRNTNKEDIDKPPYSGS